MIEQNIYAIKMVIVGPQAVGKSSIFRRYCDSVFEQNYLPTIGVDFRFKTQQVNSQLCKIQIWDTAGQQKFKSITRIYYKNANAIIIVYDVSDKQSFKAVQQYWADQAKQNADKNSLMCLVGNKVDSAMRVNRDIVESYAINMNFLSFMVSAKTGQGVQELFSTICQIIISQKLLEQAKIVCKKIQDMQIQKIMIESVS